MDHKDQIEAFARELDKLVDRFADEYDLPYASVVGVLSLKTHLVVREWQDSTEQDATD